MTVEWSQHLSKSKVLQNTKSWHFFAQTPFLILEKQSQEERNDRGTGTVVTRLYEECL